MKKLLFLGVLSLCLFSCSNDETKTTNSSEISTKSSMTARGDGEDEEFDQSPEAQKALQEFFQLYQPDTEFEFEATDREGTGEGTVKVKIGIMCSYLIARTGTVWGYGRARNGDYYFFTMHSTYNYDLKKIESRTTGYKVDAPKCH